MKPSKTILTFIAISFAVGFCHLGTELIFQIEDDSIPRDKLKQEYWQSLFVGLSAGLAILVYSFISNRKRTASK